MDKISVLMNKAQIALKEKGVKYTVNRTLQYFHILEWQDERNIVADILFINGCFLPHPHRYRVSHQIEELLAKGIVCEEVDYDKLTIDRVKYYRGFVFYRCPYTDTIGQFIDLSKKLNKTVFFDIDDLVFDRKYTDSIDYLKSLSKEELELYYDGVDRMKKTLQLCDYGITTTTALANEMKKYVKDVCINRNAASDEMLALSMEAYSCKTNHSDVVIGYFSGSITHNDDVNFILPILRQVLCAHSNVRLLLAGEVDTPNELEEYKDRILTTPFVDWKELPKLISSVDINIVPLKDTLFNEAKSENKWMEAALVHVPTIASNVGAFSEQVENGKTGILCSNFDEWVNAFELLINDTELRKKIGDNAYNTVFDNSITITKKNGLGEFIESRLRENVIFNIPVLQPRGGIIVVLRHAAYLQQNGYDVTIVNDGMEVKDYISNYDSYIPVLNSTKVSFVGKIDKAVGTLYTTMNFVVNYPNIVERCYLVQGYETNFLNPGKNGRVQIEQTYNYGFPVKYITISKWCQNWLSEKYHKTAKYAPNGIDTKMFYPKKREFNGKCRILVEGNNIDYYKNVDESFRVIERLDKDKYEIWYLAYDGQPKDYYRVDKYLKAVPYEEVSEVYRQCDILLKTSIYESFSYPPLEMMSTGGYVVAIQNGGNSEYLEDEYNCLLYEQGDIDSAVKCIERIASDSNLRRILYENGIRTANNRDWNNIKEDIVRMYN